MSEPESKLKPFTMFGYPVMEIGTPCCVCGVENKTVWMRLKNGALAGTYCDACAEEAGLKDEMDKYRRLD